MVSLRSSRLAAAIVLVSASLTTAIVNTVKPTLASDITLPASTPAAFGCYGSSQGMTWAGNYNYMTSSICQIYCLNLNMPVLGTSAGYDCYCGDYAPPLAAKLDSSECTANCTGYGLEMCGGPNGTNNAVILSIWNDELQSSISNTGDSLSSASSSSSTGKATQSATTTTPAVVTVTNSGGTVVTVIASEAASASGSTGSSGASKAGIAAGVVVGVIAIAAIIGGVWFFLRQKKRRELEEEHKRVVAVNSFINGGKPPGSSDGFSIPDMRLDPAILRDRRMSDGSIMDNQDYSRRILKVTNA